MKNSHLKLIMTGFTLSLIGMIWYCVDQVRFQAFLENVLNIGNTVYRIFDLLFLILEIRRKRNR